MWTYYGSKSNLVDLYPPPKRDKIIEPFAGSARYSLKYFDRDVLLVDKYEVVIRIWKWLQQCSERDILGLPDLIKGLDLRTLNLSEEEKMFLGMMAGTSSISPRNKVSSFASERNGRKNAYKRISDQLFKIKHWDIRLGSYEHMVNQDATWFIDPPYEFGGQAYIHSKIDFVGLSEWCKSRVGQTIVCENMRATWMPFLPIKSHRGSNQTWQTEAIWTNEKNAFDQKQLTLF